MGCPRGRWRWCAEGVGCGGNEGLCAGLPRERGDVAGWACRAGAGGCVRRKQEAVRRLHAAVPTPLAAPAPPSPRQPPPAQLSAELRPRGRGALSKVLLVGGATRMPAVRRFISHMTGLEPEAGAVDPDEAVALGAAVQVGPARRAAGGRGRGAVLRAGRARGGGGGAAGQQRAAVMRVRSEWGAGPPVGGRRTCCYALALNMLAFPGRRTPPRCRHRRASCRGRCLTSWSW